MEDSAQLYPQGGWGWCVGGWATEEWADRQTDRLTDRLTDKTDRQKDRQTARQRERQTERQRHRETDSRQIDRRADGQTDGGSHLTTASDNVMNRQHQVSEQRTVNTTSLQWSAIHTIPHTTAGLEYTLHTYVMCNDHECVCVSVDTCLHFLTDW